MPWLCFVGAVLLPVFRKSVLCLSRVLGVLAWRAGYSSHGGRRYVVCSSRQRPAPFDWRRMLTVPPLLANCPTWRAGSTASPAASPHPSQLISPGLLIGRLHCSADIQVCLQVGRFSTPLLFSGQRPQLQSWMSVPMAVCLLFRADRRWGPLGLAPCRRLTALLHSWLPHCAGLPSWLPYCTGLRSLFIRAAAKRRIL